MELYNRLQKPKPYAPSPSIWTDRYIASQMLLSHLDGEKAIASYPTSRRERVCTYLYQALQLNAGARLLDLGCGPGLYTQWFAQKGVHAVGVDMSKSSIAYAREQAGLAGQDTRYFVSDYRMPYEVDGMDAAIMISEDYGVMNPKDRITVLQNICRALKPGGCYAMDVANAAIWDTLDENASWYTEEKGFFRPHPHVVIKKTFLYPDEHAFCDLIAVCDDEITVYYTHQTVFTPERITQELKAAGFSHVETLGNLEGAPYVPDGRQIGVIARK